MAFWIPYHIWTPCHHHRPFHLADFKHFISELLHRVLLSTLKWEERKWLIALIIRDITHFRSCIKEVITPSPLSPQFPHFPAFPPFSLSPFPSPATHKNYNIIIILKPRGPAGCRHLRGGLSELGPLDFVFHALWALKPCDPHRWPVPPCPYIQPPINLWTCIHDSNIHDACIGDGCSYEPF